MRSQKEFVEEDILKKGKYGGFARVPSCWQHLPLTAGYRAVLAAMVQFAPVDQSFSKGYRTISKAAGVSVRTAQDAVRWMLDMGFLIKTQEAETGKAHTYVLNYYEITCTSLQLTDQLPDDVEAA